MLRKVPKKAYTFSFYHKFWVIYFFMELKNHFFLISQQKKLLLLFFSVKVSIFFNFIEKNENTWPVVLKSLPLVNIGLSTNLRLGDISNFLSEAINKQKMYTPGNRPKIVWGPLPFPIFGILNIRDSHRTWRPPLKPKILNYPPVTLYRIKLVILKNSY